MKFLKVAFLAMSVACCATTKPANTEIPAPAELECTLPPTTFRGLPIIEGREEEEAPFRAQAVYGGKLSDGTIVLVLLQRDGCNEDFHFVEGKVIPPPCPVGECI